jgi:hypothetical protein
MGRKTRKGEHKIFLTSQTARNILFSIGGRNDEDNDAFVRNQSFFGDGKLYF